MNISDRADGDPRRRMAEPKKAPKKAPKKTTKRGK